MPDYVERELSPDEIAKLRLDEPSESPVSPERAKALGLDVSAPPMPTLRHEDPGIISTFGHALLQGFFKQGSDEAVGRITEAVVEPGGGAAWKQPSGSVRFLNTPDDVYRAGRDTERANLAAGAEYHPIVDFLARTGGDIASDAVASAFGVPVLSTAYQVGTGALSGFLGSDADLTDDKRDAGSVTSAALSTGLGAGLGYAAPKVGAAVGRVAAPVLRRARSSLEGVAANMGRRVLQGGSDLASATREPVPPEAILEAIRSGGIVPFGTTQGAYGRLERLAAERGDMYRGILDELEGLGVPGPDAAKLAQDLYERSLVSYANTGANKEVHRELAKQGQNLINLSPEDTGRLSLSQSEAIKRDLQERARWGLLNETPLNEARKEAASVLREGTEDAIAEAGESAGPGSAIAELGESFVPAKQQLGRTIASRDLAQKGVTRLLGRRAIGLQDTLQGMALSGGDASGALLGAAGFSAARARVPSAVASGAYGLSRLAGAGARAAANNPQAMQTGGSELGAAGARYAQGGIEDYLSRTAPEPKGRAEVSSGELVEALAMNQPQALGPYVQKIQQAAADGNLPLVHFTLQQTDPEYRALLERARTGAME